MALLRTRDRRGFETIRSYIFFPPLSFSQCNPPGISTVSNKGRPQLPHRGQKRFAVHSSSENRVKVCSANT